MRRCEEDGSKQQDPQVQIPDMEDKLLALHPDGLLAAAHDRLVDRLGRPRVLGKTRQPLVQHQVQLLRQLHRPGQGVLGQVDFDTDKPCDPGEVYHRFDDGAVRRVQQLEVAVWHVCDIGVGKVAVVVFVAAQTAGPSHGKRKFSTRKGQSTARHMVQGRQRLFLRGLLF